jgi:hypothetical protein
MSVAASGVITDGSLSVSTRNPQAESLEGTIKNSSNGSSILLCRSHIVTNPLNAPSMRQSIELRTVLALSSPDFPQASLSVGERHRKMADRLSLNIEMKLTSQHITEFRGTHSLSMETKKMSESISMTW